MKLRSESPVLSIISSEAFLSFNDFEGTNAFSFPAFSKEVSNEFLSSFDTILNFCGSRWRIWNLNLLEASISTQSSNFSATNLKSHWFQTLSSWSPSLAALVIKLPFTRNGNSKSETLVGRYVKIKLSSFFRGLILPSSIFAANEISVNSASLSFSGVFPVFWKGYLIEYNILTDNSLFNWSNILSVLGNGNFRNSSKE